MPDQSTTHTLGSAISAWYNSHLVKVTANAGKRIHESERDYVEAAIKKSLTDKTYRESLKKLVKDGAKGLLGSSIHYHLPHLVRDIDIELEQCCVRRLVFKEIKERILEAVPEGVKSLTANSIGDYHELGIECKGNAPQMAEWETSNPDRWKVYQQAVIKDRDRVRSTSSDTSSDTSRDTYREVYRDNRLAVRGGGKCIDSVNKRKKTKRKKTKRKKRKKTRRKKSKKRYKTKYRRK